MSATQPTYGAVAPGNGKPRGRPTKFDDETAGKLAALIGEGVPSTHACALCDVAYQTFLNWQEKFEHFQQRIEKAKALNIATRLGRIRRAAEAGDVRADMWYLEHVHPEHFARNRIEVTGAGGQPLTGGVVILPAKDPDPIAVNRVPEALTEASGADGESNDDHETTEN